MHLPCMLQGCMEGLTECLPRRNTKELGSDFLAGSGVSDTCVLFFLYSCKMFSKSQATAKTLVEPQRRHVKVL